MIESNNIVPLQPADKRYWGAAIGAGQSLAVLHAAQHFSGLVMLVVNEFETANRFERELNSLNRTIPILSFPDWETLAYDNFSPHQDIISERLRTLYRLPTLTHGILIVPVTTLMLLLCPKEYIDRQTFLLKKNDIFDPDMFAKKLEASGYQRVSQVFEHGEFAIRGSIVDVYPMGAITPYRIDLFDNEVDTIRRFDPNSQRSQDQINEIKLLPAREYPFHEEAIATFRSRFRSMFDGDPRHCPLYQDVTKGLFSPGLEYYLPLFYETLATLFDYLPKRTLVITEQDIYRKVTEFYSEVHQRYEQFSGDLSKPILKPNIIYLEPDKLFHLFKQFPQICLQQDKVSDSAGRINLPWTPLPDLSLDLKLSDPFSRLKSEVELSKIRVIFAAESAGRRESILELLKKHQIKPVVMDSLDAAIQSTERYVLTVVPIDKGFAWPERSLYVLSEMDIFDRRIMQRRRRKSKGFVEQDSVKSLLELNIHDPVVHLEHGIGRYLGLTKITHSGAEEEFVTLAFDGSDKLYVPVASLHLISRYHAGATEHIPLHRLGTDKWQKEKKKASEQLKDVAAELLEIYAKREANKGFAFDKPDENYDAFAARFPFEETPDQLRAILEVEQDLTSHKVMDRVVCGDVGFGKTEVAMRACFIAAASSKQVAILVPTTLLAQQHFENFKDRFADFPIKIEVLSRFRSKNEQTEVLDKLKLGQVDIIIGTHKLLQSDIEFKNLGLLIIDEEHRFGVRQKEKLKSLRAEIDILTLTATPIPRTLNMSMAGIRDLSIIATPPQKRLSVKTFVREYNTGIIKEAITRELHRGGQVYFLHNEVQSIERMAKELEELVPSARIGVVHGQMPERMLEKIMGDFYHRRFNVLVCTTIIETGIDVPTANTILLNRADKLGLAQLHQLRGRVGRSHHQAYAFCLTPNKKLMTRDAIKRLEAIEASDTLGSGFTLATYDLEIRGAGELLGEEQSGNIQSLGFTLYMELLDKTVKALKAGVIPSDDLSMSSHPEIDLQIPALIPDDYLPDVNMRLLLYKRIASAEKQEHLDELKVEMIDRFGLLPQAVKNLFGVTNVKLLAAAIGIKKIKIGSQGGKIEFMPKPLIDPGKIIELVKSNPTNFKFVGSSSILATKVLDSSEERLDFATSLLESLLSRQRVAS